LLLSQGAARLVLRAVPATMMGGHQLDLSPDWRIVFYTLAVSLATSLFFGSVPALRLIRSDLTPALKAAHRNWLLSGRRIPLQSTLVAGQATITVVLLVNAGLLVRGFDRALRMDHGQSARNVLIASFNLQQEQYSAERASRFLMELRDVVAETAGVAGVSMTVNDPFVSGCGMRAWTIGADGQPSEPFLIGVASPETSCAGRRGWRSWTSDSPGRDSSTSIPWAVSYGSEPGPRTSAKSSAWRQPRPSSPWIGVCAPRSTRRSAASWKASC
jgi:hypothetical protein